MALDTTDLLTVLGKYVKTINTWNGYLSALTTAKGDIFTVLEAENLEDLYVDIPSQFAGFQSAVTSWISTLISEVEDVLTDEEYVLENLPIFASDVTTVLNAIYDQMVTEADTIKSSVVSLGGSDTNQKDFAIDNGDADNIQSRARVFLTRTLDGVNDPSSLVSAHTRYNNVEGQLSKSCTVYAKCTSSAVDSEVVQLFASDPLEASYTADAESPGVGPTLSNAETSPLFLTNRDYTNWSGDNPIGWTLAGGSAGTAWEDQSSTGDGPLRIMTAGVTAKQQIVTLERRTMYFFGAYVQCNAAAGETSTIKLRVENVSGGTVHKDFGSFIIESLPNAGGLDDDDNFGFAYGFYSPNDTVNLGDIYFCIEHDAESDASVSTFVYKTIIAPVTYFNGLGFAFWNVYDEDNTTISTLLRNPILVNEYGSIAISNNNGGVFQTFFRKAFNIQLPTADSPTISDTLAT